MFHADGDADLQQVLRHLHDSAPSVPRWRTARPSVLCESAAFVPSPTDPSRGTLLLRGYVRQLALSANQLLHIPGAGDFQMGQIDGPSAPSCAAAPRQPRRGEAGGSAMEAEGGEPPVLARADPDGREPLVRENVADPLAGEQTWPTEEVRGREARRQGGRQWIICASGSNGEGTGAVLYS